ncbi:MAG: hypothetical protein ACRDQZ_13155 [Mycobacteriales bacterium]
MFSDEPKKVQVEALKQVLRARLFGPAIRRGMRQERERVLALVDESLAATTDDERVQLTLVLLRGAINERPTEAPTDVSSSHGPDDGDSTEPGAGDGV